MGISNLRFILEIWKSFQKSLAKKQFLISV